MIRRFGSLAMTVALVLTQVLATACGQPANAAPPPPALSQGPWGANVRVNDVAAKADQERPPSIAVDPSGNAYALWTDWRNEACSDICFSYRPTGDSWGTNVRVDDDDGTAGQYGPSIAVDPSGNAYAIWSDVRSGNRDIYFSYRPAGGPWGANVRVDDDAGTATQYNASIAVDPSGNAYAVWSDYRNDVWDIYFSYRPAGGPWGTNVRVDDDAGTADQYNACIAVDPSGNAYTVWHDNRNGPYDIYFSYRPTGDSWGTNVRVDEDAGTAPWWWAPSIAVDPAGNAYAVWQDDRNCYGNHDIYFSYRPAGGPWGTNVRVDDDAGTADQYNACIAVDPSGNAYVVWTDMRAGDTAAYPSGADIYFSNLWAFKVYVPLILRNHQ